VSQVTKIRQVLRARIAAALADRAGICDERLDEIESIAYNSVQSLKPNVLRNLMQHHMRKMEDGHILIEIPFIIAAELALEIIQARADDYHNYDQICA
jgi:hypothetical protein